MERRLMKVIGLIGGINWNSTFENYKDTILHEVKD